MEGEVEGSGVKEQVERGLGQLLTQIEWMTLVRGNTVMPLKKTVQNDDF